MKVFISYAFENRKLMITLKNSLEKQKIEVYTGEHDVALGKSLSKKIQVLIKKSNALIAIITKDNNSASVNQEIGYAKNEDILIIPVVESGADMGFILGDVEYVQLDKKKMNKMCEKVTKYITILSASFDDTTSAVRHSEMKEILKRMSKLNSDDVIHDVVLQGDFKKYESQIVNTFEDLTRKMLEMIEFAQKEIIIMFRFSNELIINSILKKANAGVRVKVLMDTDLISKFFEESGISISKKDVHTRQRVEIVANPFYPSKVDRRYVSTPFFAIVVDDKHVGIEIIDNYNPHKFKTAIFASDVSLSNEVRHIVDNLWKTASRNPPTISLMRNKR